MKIVWGELEAIEPDAALVHAHADALAAAYNEPGNAAMMGHTDAISPDDVREMYARAATLQPVPEARNERSFLFFSGGELAGDGDLRNISAGRAEFAFLIAAPSAQGRGLGTRFALMVHALGFDHLGLERIYASIIPANTASRRVFEKLGYALDDSPLGRSFADEPGDVVMSTERAAFLARHADALAEIRVVR